MVTLLARGDEAPPTSVKAVAGVINGKVHLRLRRMQSKSWLKNVTGIEESFKYSKLYHLESAELVTSDGETSRIETPRDPSSIGSQFQE